MRCKLLKLSLILILLTHFFTTNSFAQNTNPQKLYYFFDDIGNSTSNYTKKNNIEKVKFIDEHAFANGQYLGLDVEKLKREIGLLFPAISDFGFCYIDLESPYIDKLINNEVHEQSFQIVLNYYVKIITIAKTIRPNVKWGFYGIPFTTYWELDKGFFKKYKKLEPLLKISDVLFPSMYFFYSDDEPNGLYNERFVKENTIELIKIANEYNKPLYPFVMERYHPSNQAIGMSKIPEKEFLKYLDIMLQTTVNKNRIDGLVWWNADKYFYTHKAIKNADYTQDLKLILSRNSACNLRLMKKIKQLIK